MIKTFRGLLADGAQDRIRLQTIKGKVGYRIVKFQIISNEPFAKSGEHVCKMYKSLQTTINALVNFTDSDLIGTAVIRHSAGEIYPQAESIIFDTEIFNQDIYVTHSDINTDNTSLNYYIELEVIPLDDAGAEYTTLKDMRQPGWRSSGSIGPA